MPNYKYLEIVLVCPDAQPDPLPSSCPPAPPPHWPFPPFPEVMVVGPSSAESNVSSTACASYFYLILIHIKSL